MNEPPNLATSASRSLRKTQPVRTSARATARALTGHRGNAVLGGGAEAEVMMVEVTGTERDKAFSHLISIWLRDKNANRTTLQAC